MKSFDFARELMLKLSLDAETVDFFVKLAERVLSDESLHAETDAILDMLAVYDTNADYNAVSARCDELAAHMDCHEYSVTAFIWLAAAEILHGKLAAKGLGEEVFLQTADDIRCKLEECRKMYGVIGSFVREWLFAFYRVGRFGLGRLQFELTRWWSEPIKVGEHIICTGDSCVGFHIPSNGKPFTSEARKEAYRMAAELFADSFPGDVIPFSCSSWLLDPMNQRYLPESSNIRRFADDFETVVGKKTEKFTNTWRIFYKDESLPPEQLPENSSLERAYKKRIVNQDQFYNGCGIFWMKKS